MIRFQPDTLTQGVLRFFDMVAPDANVYVEIPAPDIRFAAIVLLALAAALTWRRLGAARKPVLAMLAVLLVSTVAWLATTGNGRYFMAMLICAGPLAIALVCLLPLTRAFKASLALLLVAVQAFLLVQQTPWDTWTVLHWTDRSYFEVNLGPEEKTGPATTYASLSLLSYSLIAPQFPARSRWTSLHASPLTPADALRSDTFLRRAAAEGPVKLIAPSLPAASLPDGTPNSEMLAALDKLIAPRNLRITAACRFFGSRGLLDMAERERSLQEGVPPTLGFWTCPVAYEPGLARALAREASAAPADVRLALDKLAELCPRFFAPNETSLRRLADGWVRHYDSQTRVVVLDNGDVLYQFWRALNPVRVGKTSELIAGEVQFDCLGVRNDGAWKTGAQ